MPQQFWHGGLNLAPNLVPEMVEASDIEHATSLECQSESTETTQQWRMYTAQCLQEFAISKYFRSCIYLQSYPKLINKGKC